MSRMILLFSHQNLSATQLMDAQKHWKVSGTVNLPPDLQALFSNVPPDLETLNEYAQPIINWLISNAQSTDILLIQGEFGLTYLLVEWCKTKSLKAVYATTERINRTDEQTGEIIKIFSHVRFRQYF
jgi:hypothetical protein